MNEFAPQTREWVSAMGEARFGLSGCSCEQGRWSPCPVGLHSGEDSSKEGESRIISNRVMLWRQSVQWVGLRSDLEVYCNLSSHNSIDGVQILATECLGQVMKSAFLQRRPWPPERMSLAMHPRARSVHLDRVTDWTRRLRVRDKIGLVLFFHTQKLNRNVEATYLVTTESQ